MHLLRRVLLPYLLGSVLLAGAAAADDEPIILTNGRGTTLTFAPVDGAWFWTRLAAPSGPADGWAISDETVDLASADRDELLGGGWRLAENDAEKVVLEQDSPLTGLSIRRSFGFGGAANTLRIETWVRSLEGTKVVARIGLLDVRIVGEGFHETGPAPASFPLFGDNLFAGIEHVSGECSTDDDPQDRVRLLQRPRLTVDDNWRRVATAVVGWPQPGTGGGFTGEARIREAFLQYLDTVSVKPADIVLHSDSWWTVPLPLSESKVLAELDTLGKAFAGRTGMFFDSYCIDLGWSDPRSFWGIDTQRMPTRMRTINDRLSSLGARMGLWLSPGSGYPDGLSNSWLQGQGYEMTPFESLGVAPCMALGGRYQREFKERAVAYAQEHNLGHVILDFMVQRCDVPTHGHPVGPESRYAIDAGLADVLDALRAVNPRISLEPMVCGYPPSPWWLMKTPFVVGPVGDDQPYGRGPCPDWLESLTTARDIAYRAGQEAWIMPTQALETFDIIVLTPGDFRNMAVMAVGRGRWFLSTYFKSDLMKPEDWDFLAALVRWERENKGYLGNAWMIGGHPENREAYGFMFRNPDKDLFCVRNPWVESRTIELPASPVAVGARDVQMIYPRREIVGRLTPGGPALTVTLPAYETAFFETKPAADGEPESVQVPDYAVAVVAPSATRAAAGGKYRFSWGGTLNVPEVIEPELHILVEGGAAVKSAECTVLLSGRAVKARQTTSAGQFGAAISASPENWAWFIVPLPQGETSFQIDVSAPLEDANVTVYARGFTPASSAPAPEEGAVFPTNRSDRRPWSQTLQPAPAAPESDASGQ
jgi:hypothetical protein